MKKRRHSDYLRALADKAWARGSKDLSIGLHEQARKEEKNRKPR